MITHSHISRVIVFLGGLLNGRIGSIHELRVLAQCSDEDRCWVERFCELCRLTSLTHGARDALSEKGRSIAETYERDGDLQLTFRAILREYVCEARPPWAYRIPCGREEAFSAMNSDELFCFKEAGLFGQPVTRDVVLWWDEVAARFRSAEEASLLNIGRIGEQLAMAYELRRTGRQPYWVSVESNFAGYDILSCEDAGSSTRRLIEVKSTGMSLQQAEFFISRNEWDTASSCMEHYYFYLYHLGDTNDLAVVSALEMKYHVAKNCGCGKWMSVAVPFRVFSSSFHSLPGALGSVKRE